MSVGAFTRAEIASQPQVWQATLEQMAGQWDALAAQVADLRQRPFVVAGCGSTYYLALHAASLLRSVGVDARALPSSELAFFPQTHLPPGFVLLVISRSGTTTETLWAMEAYRRHAGADGKIVAITCVPATPMVAGSDVLLLADAAQEQS
ncbi:MAG: SIS domain-containing protein, partial [Caldilineaceae bacterium]